MLETLRSNGLSNQEILTQIEQRSISQLEALNAKFDFNDLVKLANQNKDAFKSIVLNGYEVKFVTFKGMQRLLLLKFNKVEEQDYRLLDKGITGLWLDLSQLSNLKQMLSQNWVVHEEPSKDSDHLSKEIRIELVY